MSKYQISKKDKTDLDIKKAKYLETYERYISCKLKNKYKINVEIYNINIINKIIYNEKERIVAKFKDYLIMDDKSEFLKRYYKLNESDVRLKNFFEYYESYSKIYPNYTSLPEGKYFYINIQKKQKLIDILEEIEYKNNIEKQRDLQSRNINNLDSKLKTNLNDPNFFSTDVYNSIINDINVEDNEILFGVKNSDIPKDEADFGNKVNNLIDLITKLSVNTNNYNSNYSNNIGNRNICNSNSNNLLREHQINASFDENKLLLKKMKKINQNKICHLYLNINNKSQPNCAKNQENYNSNYNSNNNINLNINNEYSSNKSYNKNMSYKSNFINAKLNNSNKPENNQNNMGSSNINNANNNNKKILISNLLDQNKKSFSKNKNNYSAIYKYNTTERNSKNKNKNKRYIAIWDTRTNNLPISPIKNQNMGKSSRGNLNTNNSNINYSTNINTTNKFSKCNNSDKEKKQQDKITKINERIQSEFYTNNNMNTNLNINNINNEESHKLDYEKPTFTNNFVYIINQTPEFPNKNLVSENNKNSIEYINRTNEGSEFGQINQINQISQLFTPTKRNIRENNINNLTNNTYSTNNNIINTNNSNSKSNSKSSRYLARANRTNLFSPKQKNKQNSKQPKPKGNLVICAIINRNNSTTQNDLAHANLSLHNLNNSVLKIKRCNKDKSPANLAEVQNGQYYTSRTLGNNNAYLNNSHQYSHSSVKEMKRNINTNTDSNNNANLLTNNSLFKIENIYNIVEPIKTNTNHYLNMFVNKNKSSVFNLENYKMQGTKNTKHILSSNNNTNSYQNIPNIKNTLTNNTSNTNSSINISVQKRKKNDITITARNDNSTFHHLYRLTNISSTLGSRKNSENNKSKQNNNKKSNKNLISNRNSAKDISISKDANKKNIKQKFLNVEEKPPTSSCINIYQNSKYKARQVINNNSVMSSNSKSKKYISITSRNSVEKNLNKNSTYFKAKNYTKNTIRVQLNNNSIQNRENGDNNTVLTTNNSVSKCGFSEIVNKINSKKGKETKGMHVRQLSRCFGNNNSNSNNTNTNNSSSNVVKKNIKNCGKKIERGKK